VCERHGRSLDELDDANDADELALDQPALAACYGASVSDRQLLGVSATRLGSGLASSCIRSRSRDPTRRSPNSVASTCTQARRSTVEIADDSSDCAGTSRDQLLRSDLSTSSHGLWWDRAAKGGTLG
jgi:hypothetical protein